MFRDLLSSSPKMSSAGDVLTFVVPRKSMPASLPGFSDGLVLALSAEAETVLLVLYITHCLLHYPTKGTHTMTVLSKQKDCSLCANPLLRPTSSVTTYKAKLHLFYFQEVV